MVHKIQTNLVYTTNEMDKLKDFLNFYFPMSHTEFKINANKNYLIVEVHSGGMMLRKLIDSLIAQGYIDR